jgi:hypothetical protein
MLRIDASNRIIVTVRSRLLFAGVTVGGRWRTA